MKRMVVFLFLVVAVIAMSGCSSSPQELLVGKWVNSEPPKNRRDIFRGFHFFEDGTISLLTTSGGIGGSYSFVDEDKVKMTMKGWMGLAGPQIYTMDFSDADTLVLKNVTMPDMVVHLRRASS
jgi:hypothetical protein